MESEAGGHMEDAPMTRIVMFSALLLASAATLAAAGPLGNVSGHCTFDKTKKVTFVDGLALAGYAFLNSKEQVTLVRVSSIPLSAFHPDLFVDPSEALDAFSSDIVTLEIDRNGRLQGLGPSGSFRSGFAFTGGAVKNGRISGTVSGTGGGADGDACQITFDVPLVADYGAGKPLPPDGGDPGTAMRSFWSSLKNDDSAATVALLGESLVAAAKHGTMPQFVIVFGAGGGDRVAGGKLYGAGRAILDIDAEPATKAHALLLKQGDRWRVQDVSFE